MDTTSTPVRDSRQRRFRIVVIVVSVAVAIVGSILLAIRDASKKTTTVGAAVTLRVPAHPGAVIAGPDALWVALSGDSQNPAEDGRLLRLDLATGAQAPVYLSGQVSNLARVRNRLIASVQHVSGLAELAALEWRSGVVLGRHFFNPPVDQIVRHGSELWALEVRPGALLRVDPETLEQASVPLPLSPGRTLALASGGGYLWVTAADAGEVLRIDPATRTIKRVHVVGLPIGIVLTGGSVWYADHEGGTVARLDPRTLRPVGEPIRVGNKPTWLVAAAGSLFVTDQNDGTVAQIDVHSGKVVGLPIRIARPTSDAPAPSVAPAGQSVWVSSFVSNTLNRIDSTTGRDQKSSKLTVRIAGMNDKQQGDHVTNGGVASTTGHFTASGAISATGKVVVYRTMKGPLITLRYVTSTNKGTITFVVKIDTSPILTSHWTITSATKAYRGLHGEGTEHENAHNTVSILTGTVTR